jgi:hypothetical protein
MSALAHETRNAEAAQAIGATQARAVDNYMSAVASASQLADIGELEKAARLLRRSITSAKKAGCIMDYAAIENRAVILQREGYIAAVDRQIERAERRAAKGELAEVESSITFMEECAVKARELGGGVVIDTARVDAALAKARQLAAQTAERDRIISDHLNKVGEAFLSLYEAATGDPSIDK